MLPEREKRLAFDYMVNHRSKGGKSSFHGDYGLTYKIITESSFEHDGFLYSGTVAILNVFKKAQFREQMFFDGVFNIPKAIRKDEKWFLITAIGDNAFECLRCQKIIIPDTVVAIGERAFYKMECGIRRLHFQDIVYLGDSAFAESDICTLIFDNNPIIIKRSAFSKCKDLKNVTWGRGDVLEIENHAFAWCNLQGTHALPGEVKSVSSSAFICNPALDVLMINEKTRIFWKTPEEQMERSILRKSGGEKTKVLLYV